MACLSGILMTAVTLAILLIEIYNSKFRNITEHLLLGGTVSVLFFVLCNYGFELVNWVFLGIIPVYIIISWIGSLVSRSSYDSSDSCNSYDSCEPCNTCKEPVTKCKCPNKSPDNSNSYKKSSLNCPANPVLRMGAKCGISRFT
jgi:hypothetical protein